MTNEELQSLESAAIAACEHPAATVEDRDAVFSPDGLKVEFVQELIICPDCPLSDWFVVDMEKRKAEEL